MARPPQGPAAAQTPRQRLEQRYRDTAQAADEANAHVVDMSERHLARLLRGTVAARFAAFDDPNSPLTPEDRGKLLQALERQPPPARPISAGTASRLAIWRSRLPYRAVPWTVRGLSAILVVGLAVLAWHRTPERSIEVTGTEAQPVRWQLPGGDYQDSRLNPGERYVLVRQESTYGLLRRWYPGRGYGEAWVALSLPQQGR